MTLPADAGAGLGVFETLHDIPSAAALADHLRTAARTFYGNAGRAFLARLVEARHRDSEALLAGIAAARESFVARHASAGADGQARSIGSRFALIAVAGKLATKLGVLPWQEAEATAAAANCLKSRWLLSIRIIPPSCCHSRAGRGSHLHAVKLPEAKRGFVLLPRRWVVERSFAWATCSRRLVEDYERYAETLASFHLIAFIGYMLKRAAALAQGA